MQHGAMSYDPANTDLRLALGLAAAVTGPTVDKTASELASQDFGAQADANTRAAVVLTWTENRDGDGRTRHRPAQPVRSGAGAHGQRRRCLRSSQGVRGEGDLDAPLREAFVALCAMMQLDALPPGEPEIAAPMDAEGVRHTVRPRPLLAAGVLATLQRAIGGMQFIYLKLAAVRYPGTAMTESVSHILWACKTQE